MLFAVSTGRAAISYADKFPREGPDALQGETKTLHPYWFSKQGAHLGNTSSLQAREATTPAGCSAASDWGAVQAGLVGAAPWGSGAALTISRGLDI